MPTPRVDEILDRLAEMRLALPGLTDRSPTALRYLSRELEALIEECADWTGRWQEALEQSRRLARELEEARLEGAQSHTED